MGPLRFAGWAIGRVLFLAAQLVFYLIYPLFVLWYLLKWWEERRRK